MRIFQHYPLWSRWNWIRITILGKTAKRTKKKKKKQPKKETKMGKVVQNQNCTIGGLRRIHFLDSLAHTTLTRQYIYMSRLPNHDIWYAHYNLVGWVWKYTEILIVSKVIYSLYTLIFMVNLTCHHNKSFLANHTQSTLFSNFERFF